MVDWNNETTVGIPALDVMRIYLLEKKADCEEAWRWFRDKDFEDVEQSLAKVKSRLEVWYFVMEPMIQRHWKGNWNNTKIDIKDIEKQIENGETKDIRNIIKAFNSLLDYLKITRLDNKRTYDSSNIEEENKEMAGG